MKTKADRNQHLTVKPKFIFHSGQHPTPTQSQNVSQSKPLDDDGGKERNTAKSSSSERTAEACCDRVQKFSSRGRILKPVQHYTPTTTALKVENKRFSRVAQYLHLKFGCQNLDYIQRTAQLGHIKGIPADIAKYNINCPLCKIAAATKIPRGGLRDTTEMRKGSAFHMDWLIFNTESCRGFKTALLITETVTRQKWAFPTRS